MRYWKMLFEQVEFKPYPKENKMKKQDQIAKGIKRLRFWLANLFCPSDYELKWIPQYHDDSTLYDE